jgi:hypothetical protein
MGGVQAPPTEEDSPPGAASPGRTAATGAPAGAAEGPTKAANTAAGAAGAGAHRNGGFTILVT